MMTFSMLLFLIWVHEVDEQVVMVFLMMRWTLSIAGTRIIGRERRTSFRTAMIS